MVKAFFNRFSPVATTLSAKLQGVAGHTGSGRTSYVALKSGRKALVVDLRGVAGLRADLVRDGQLVAVMGCDDGVVKVLIDSSGDNLPYNLETGDLIQIRQNSHVILQGVLERSRSVNASLMILFRMMKRIATRRAPMIR